MTFLPARSHWITGRLRGEPVAVGDVDVVIEPAEANLRRLHEALAGLAPTRYSSTWDTVAIAYARRLIIIAVTLLQEG